jgi:hypothetical protein
MVHAKRTTRTTGATGENLVSNALMQCLDWIPRKEELDEGIDFNVEIPAHPPHPGRRFLTQVKTKSRFSDRKDGSWTVTIRSAIARKYRSLREPVFLFAVDLQRNEIRWANMLAALQVAPELRTFTLRPAHILKPDTACELRSAVLAAFDEADDKYHPPLQAVRYRALKLEGLNPGFTVKGAVVAEDALTKTQFQNLTLAFQLLQQSPIPFNGQRYPIIPTEEGTLALRASNPVSLTLQMSLELSHGQAVLGRMPVRSIVHKFTVSDNPDGILIVEANEADLMWDREEQKDARRSVGLRLGRAAFLN